MILVLKTVDHLLYHQLIFSLGFQDISLLIFHLPSFLILLWLVFPFPFNLLESPRAKVSDFSSLPTLTLWETPFNLIGGVNITCLLRSSHFISLHLFLWILNFHIYHWISNTHLKLNTDFLVLTNPFLLIHPVSFVGVFYISSISFMYRT